MKDDAPAKIAAQRAAGPGRLEDEDQRWGIAAARERKRARDDRDRKPPSTTIILGAPAAETPPNLAPAGLR
jgi:hypothetical protein